MQNGDDQVSYTQPGYQTLENEAEARLEARGYFSRRFLRVIRGHLREHGGFRWWLALLMVACGVLAWLIVDFLSASHHSSPFGMVWRSGFAVLATWPVYVFALYVWAKALGRNLNLAGKWDALASTDQLGEIEDQGASEKVESAIGGVWRRSDSYTGYNGTNLTEYWFLAIASIATWFTWDLLNSGLALMAEIILDGVVVPKCPELRDRISCERWYETALYGTILHFFAVAVCASLAVMGWVLRTPTR